jgi:hypothetical protein
MVAERELQHEILAVDPYAGEEFITERFCGVLTTLLNDASDKRRIERAFLRDLEAAFPDAKISQVLPKLAEGLGARISRHGRHIETKTGGDLGFVLIRPTVDRNFSVLTPGLYQRGLLAQAKLRHIQTGNWGSLTANQKKVLPKRLDYLALLLYSYSGNQPGKLDPFRWQICSGFKLWQVSKWLDEDNFPSQQSSDLIIKALGAAKIGTDDQRTIDEYIVPKDQPALILEITWPGRRPPDPVRIGLLQSPRPQYVNVLAG